MKTLKSAGLTLKLPRRRSAKTQTQAPEAPPDAEPPSPPQSPPLVPSTPELVHAHTPPFSPADRPAKRARVMVEEVEDEGDSVTSEVHPTAGGFYPEISETRWETKFREAEAEGLPPWAPFLDEDEMDYAHCMWGSGMSQASMDKTLKLNIVSCKKFGNDEEWTDLSDSNQ